MAQPFSPVCGNFTTQDVEYFSQNFNYIKWYIVIVIIIVDAKYITKKLNHNSHKMKIKKALLTIHNKYKHDKRRQHKGGAQG